MEKKRFKKQELKSDDYKGMEQGAKAVKGFLAVGVAAVALVTNKENLKTLTKGVTNLAKTVLKR